MDDFSTDQGTSEINATVARVLLELREEIIRDWVERAQKHIDSASDVERPILVNTLPAFIDNLAEALSPSHPRKDATDSNTVAQEHGGERARMTHYGADQLLYEYQILREVLLEKLAGKVELNKNQREVIQRSFDYSIRQAVLAFSIMQSRLREHFVAALTHDLRNPLGATKMSLEVILSTLEDIEDENLRKDLTSLVSRAMNNTRRADRLIQNLLDVAVLHAGEDVHLNLVECDLFAIVHEVIKELSARDQSRIHIKGHTARGIWDPDALRRAVENLVSNALKYGTVGTPVNIAVSVANERAMLTVHNEGEPIPASGIENLFQVFNRSQSAKKGIQKGWGIGLALVRAVAEAHGGNISVDSSKERGNTFGFDIPVDARPFRKKKVKEN
jgi:signal transduction histidine kinase